ncbi:scavenger receptor cysteine-rich type 1 protein M130-like [Sphaeramia orbicularis]|uniref:scavenger receptor cysteine-rich type 1 protein M130-like n=1 Tax=Sphaeramia orbicularis TaxID=375764 RepID=UPI00117EEB5D|nr:scavenger receptor cysteine-rich type 1 protein M130-like [Sphaeramia orbicularis]
MDHRVLMVFLSVSGLLAENKDNSTGSYDFRLVGGGTHCAGKLQMRQQAEDWKPVDGFYWTLKLANTVCAELDCGSAVSVRSLSVETLVTDVWEIRPNCESSLWSCFTTGKYPSLVLQMTCSDSVRLVNGSSLCSGRLEVQSSWSWSLVCAADFGLQAAEGVCRELGCGAPSGIEGVLYGEDEAPLCKTVICEGHGSVLPDCGSSGSDTCSSRRAVHLTCSDPGDVRLEGGGSRCNGTVQVKHLGDWRNLKNYYDWTLRSAAIICSRLDCGSPVHTGIKDHESEHLVWEVRPSCVQSTPTLRDCVTTEDRGSYFSLELTCSDSVRMLHGTGLCSGRLEIQTNQSWSSVCDGGFGLQVAQVVCRELGCGAPSVFQGVLHGEDEAPVWTRELQCEGNESTILDCGGSSSGKTCSTGKTVELTCAEPVRLVGQPSSCAGAVEIKHCGEWRPVTDFYNQWDQMSAAVMCKHLDCGSAVSINKRSDFSSRPVWFVSPTCVNVTSTHRDCVELHPVSEDESGLEVVCTDLLLQPNISLSPSSDGVSEVYQHGFRVLMYADFTIRCSIEPQYPGGSFQLISDTLESQNRTEPAVNHSADFLFSAAGHAHRGDYTCIYHVHVFNHSFSSQSRALYLTIGAPVTELIIRTVVVLLLMVLCNATLYFCCKANRGRFRLRSRIRSSVHHLQHNEEESVL